MPQFKAGDRVLRTEPGSGSTVQGNTYTVRELLGTVLRLVEVSGSYIPRYFELVPQVQPGLPMLLTADPTERKGTPITTGVLDYFPQALAYVSRVSKAGNDQHNPGQPLHWAKGKSMDHADCIARHLIDRTTNDSDGLAHAGKLAWRALALLQTMIDEGTMPKENTNAV